MFDLTVFLTLWISLLSQRLVYTRCCRLFEASSSLPSKNQVVTLQHDSSSFSNTRRQWQTCSVVQLSCTKTCTNRKPATQKSLLKKLADGNSEEKFLEKQKQWEVNHKKVGTKAQFMTFIKPSVHTKPSCTFWFRLNRISLRLSTLQVQMSRQKARDNSSAHEVTRDWLRPLAITSV